jgi:hypothetical protein
MVIADSDLLHYVRLCDTLHTYFVSHAVGDVFTRAKAERSPA